MSGRVSSPTPNYLGFLFRKMVEGCVQSGIKMCYWLLKTIIWYNGEHVKVEELDSADLGTW